MWVSCGGCKREDGRRGELDFFFFQAEDGIRDLVRSRGLGDGYQRQAKDPLKIQPFMKKCFEAVKEVEFSDDVTMRAMISVEGERVALSKEINPSVDVACTNQLHKT